MKLLKFLDSNGDGAGYIKEGQEGRRECKRKKTK